MDQMLSRTVPGLELQLPKWACHAGQLRCSGAEESIWKCILNLAKNTPNQSSLIVVEDHHVPEEDKCPVPGSVPGQAAWSFEQSGLKMKGGPASGRGLKLDDL